MFSFYRGDTLVGHSRLESGDAPMAVASGEFFPSEAFASFRSEMTDAVNGAGRIFGDWRCLCGVTVRNQNGDVMDWQNVEISEFGDPESPFAYEALCIGLDTYGEVFPDHVKAYADQFNEPSS